MWSVDACRMGTPFSYATGGGHTMVPETMLSRCHYATDHASLHLHWLHPPVPPLYCAAAAPVVLAAGKYNEADNSLLLFNYQVSSTLCWAELSFTLPCCACILLLSDPAHHEASFRTGASA